MEDWMRWINWTATALCFAGIGGSFAAAQDEPERRTAEQVREEFKDVKEYLLIQGTVESVGHRMTANYGKIRVGDKYRVKAEITNGLKLAFNAKLKPSCGCVILEGQTIAFEPGQTQTIEFSIEAMQEAAQKAINIDFEDVEVGVHFSLAFAYESVFVAKLESEAVVAPTKEESRATVKVLPAFEGVKVTSVEVVDGPAELVGFDGETVDLKMTATADMLDGVVRLQAVVDDRGKEKKVPLLVKVDYTGVAKLLPSTIRLQGFADNTAKGSLLLAGAMHVSDVGKARVFVRCGGSEYEGRIGEVVPRSGKVKAVFVAFDRVEDLDDSAKIFVELPNGIVASAKVRL
jgi:hypothetical protein